jgi:plastocyanin
VVAVVPTQATTPASTPAPKLQPTTVHVSITNSGFTPANITIAVGSTVVWTNNGGIPHTATDSGKFDSGELNVGATYQFTFTTPGTYNYVCSYHPYMVGTIIVQ